MLKETPAELRKLLRDVIEDTTRRDAAEQFMRNCLELFRSYSTDPTHTHWWLTGDRRFGADWLKVFFVAVAESFNTTPLFDMCDFRVATAPIEHMVMRYRLVYEDGIALRYQPQYLNMHTNMVRGFAPCSEAFSRYGPVNVWYRLVDAVMDCMMGNVVHGMYRVRATGSGKNPPMDRVVSSDLLVEAIEEQSDAIARSIGVDQANHILVGDEAAAYLPIDRLPNYTPSRGIHLMGRLRDRWNVYIDENFLKDGLMIWRYAPGDGENFAVARLYTVGFTTEFETAVFRHVGQVVGPDYVRVLRVQ